MAEQENRVRRGQPMRLPMRWITNGSIRKALLSVCQNITLLSQGEDDLKQKWILEFVSRSMWKNINLNNDDHGGNDNDDDNADAGPTMGTWWQGIHLQACRDTRWLADWGVSIILILNIAFDSICSKFVWPQGPCGNERNTGSSLQASEGLSYKNSRQGNIRYLYLVQGLHKVLIYIAFWERFAVRLYDIYISLQ